MKRSLLLAAAMPLLIMGGCASRGDVDTLRQEIAAVRAVAETADQKATAAQAAAERAAADSARAAEEASLASEKADRIFRSGLRK
jgi:outer membrane murein-binding lipoprotein Lpp